MQTRDWQEAVKGFLKAYIEAFTANDGARIARLYHAPCITVRGDGSIHSFQSQSEIQAFFQTLGDTYYREGCRGWKYENLEVSPLGGRSAVATMDWQMQREDGSTIRRWRQSYNFVEVDGQLRVLASTFHSA